MKQHFYELKQCQLKKRIRRSDRVNRPQAFEWMGTHIRNQDQNEGARL